ncbi:E3 ubiquitin-protein ligase PPP1R11 [Hyalella azteca]|uniref:E3 ubiquitin-protein ligase PPP1R11 n=1 Tax=Hyalella azteca TaxID=294128 RepID=A0A8B7P5D7_HYAAZ|nr:E3 ubiquitin-protein ligase PPP1R11 [Hyalella azteca]
MSAMMSDSSGASTVVQNPDQQSSPEQVAREVVRLKLTRGPKHQKKVKWTNNTVDNENLGKKKSKCCCVYVKPRNFDESETDESEGECENCSGHVEKRKHGSGAPPPDDPPPTGGPQEIQAAN